MPLDQIPWHRISLAFPPLEVIVDGRRELGDQSVAGEAVSEIGVRGQLSVNQLSERTRVDTAAMQGRHPVPPPLLLLQFGGISLDLGTRGSEQSDCHCREHPGDLRSGADQRVGVKGKSRQLAGTSGTAPYLWPLGP